MPRRLSLTIALAACSSSSPPPAPAPAPAPPPPPPPPSDRCADIGRHEHELFAPMRAQALEQAKSAGLTVRLDGEVVSSSGSNGPKLRAWPREVTGTSCSDDSWPVAVQRCLVAATDTDAWSRCLDSLSPPLRLRHRHRVDGEAP